VCVFIIFLEDIIFVTLFCSVLKHDDSLHDMLFILWALLLIWSPFQTHYFSVKLLVPGIEPGPLDL
jgi:hypothetical protein